MRRRTIRPPQEGPATNPDEDVELPTATPTPRGVPRHRVLRMSGVTTSTAADEFAEHHGTPRGAHPRSHALTRTSLGAITNFVPLAQIELTASRPLLRIAGENARSRYCTQDAYAVAPGTGSRSSPTNTSEVTHPQARSR